jgi:hypothetical protein
MAILLTLTRQFLNTCAIVAPFSMRFPCQIA